MLIQRGFVTGAAVREQRVAKSSEEPWTISSINDATITLRDADEDDPEEKTFTRLELYMHWKIAENIAREARHTYMCAQLRSHNMRCNSLARVR